jgi:hypothetical protein
MKEQIQKDKRVNSRFLTALLVAEAALRPIANDWAHLDEGELNDIIRCLHTINDLQGQARAYEDYLDKQLQTADAVREGGRGDSPRQEQPSPCQSSEAGENTAAI